MFTMKLDAKRTFFDRAAVMNAVNKAKMKALRHGGGLVRKIARNSMDKRAAAARPGQPPSAHIASQFGLKNILFAYDKSRDSVVVGPIAFGAKTHVPPGMEFGLTFTQPKTVVIESRQKTGKGAGTVYGARAAGKGKKQQDVRRRIIRKGESVNIEARPFMLPALEAAAPELPAEWQNSISRG